MIRSLLLVAALVVLFVLTSASPLAQIEKKQEDLSGRCIVNGYVYRHGQVFTIPGVSHCVRYRCNNGGWSIFEEGCEHNGRCHPVNSSFDDNCRTYTCTKSVRNGYSHYQPISTRTRCRDHYGTCHESGSQFSYAINGRVYDSCSCSVQSGGYVSYTCNWGG